MMTDMKGVILAGGLGTRLYPLTHATNKHLLPVYDQPMVFYPIRTLVNAGVTDILIVTGGPHAGHFMRVLQNGKALGIKRLSFAYQDTGDGGIADALKLAEDFADGDSVVVILGDNTTDADIGHAVSSFKEGARVFLKKVPDPQRFGVPVFSAKNPKKIVAIEEKPENPKSEYAVTGLYIYDNKCFKYVKKLKPSERGQLEVTDLNNIYIKNGTLDWELLQGFWTDAGKFETLYLANMYWAAKKGL
jgi:glucose-1-phosphate thymidylyltransferase